jgi:hypothetical protein
MTSDSKKPGVVFWAIVGVSLPVLYLLSFGPACWLFWKPWCPTAIRDSIDIAYEPAQQLLMNGPEPIRKALLWYTDLFVPHA